MKPKSIRFLPRGPVRNCLALAFITAAVSANAAQQIVNPPAGATDITVGNGDTVWFDSTNTNTAVPLATVNGVAPPIGFLPGWAHTQYGFVKFDGTKVTESANADKVVGPANLATATAASDYYDNLAVTNLTASQSIGFVETTRDFVISNGATLDVARGGLMYHNNSHWVKTGAGGGFVTSASGQLVIVTNGGGTDYQLNGVVAKDFDGTTPLRLVKTGSDHLNLTAANTYSGGTWVNNGRLRAANVAAYGLAGTTVKVTGANSQASLGVGGTYNYNFELEGLGWTEGAIKRGALRFEATGAVSGNVTLTGASRIVANTGVTGTISGTLAGATPLEIGLTGDGTVSNGTITLAGSAAGMTGPVTVTTGRLNVNAALGGNVTVASAASIGGEGSIAGNLTIGGAPSSGIAVNGATPGALAVAGTLDVSGGLVGITTTGTPAAPATSFTALTYGTLVGPVSNLTVTGLRGGSVSNDSGNSRIVVNYTPGNLTWTGLATANWAANGDLNWDDGGPTSFMNGDKVSFTDSAPVKTLTIVGMVTPSSVTFNNASDYTVNGTGAGIVGATGITKNGTGTVNLGGQNSTFTGPVVINQGRLKFTTLWEALGNTSGVTIASGAQLDLNGNQPNSTGRRYVYTIAGAGPDGNGAITNSNAAGSNEGAGIRDLILSADASVGGNAGRFDIGVPALTPASTITGNGHTLTKVGSSQVGFRADASASPVNFVIAGGTSWAENTDGAWGGLTGTLRVKSGAKAGTYGTRIIDTPVFLEAGSTLHNQGGGTGTWYGAITLEGDATFEALADPIDLNGAVTGAFSITKTGAAKVYLADPQYTGNTTVSAGILSLGEATLADNSTVSIGATATLDLLHGQTDVVDKLVIGGLGVSAGLYGSTASGVANPDDVHFSGTGILSVTTTGDAYLSWETANGIAGAGATADSDNDGIPNGIEFVIGGDPSGPGSDSNSLLIAPTVDATYLNFKYHLDPQAAAYGPFVEYGSDLTGWTKAVAGQPAANPVVIDTVGNDVTVRIPRALAANGRLFARLRVSIP
jgi:autotransporter-associated beta strand protein